VRLARPLSAELPTRPGHVSRPRSVKGSVKGIDDRDDRRRRVVLHIALGHRRPNRPAAADTASLRPSMMSA